MGGGGAEVELALGLMVHGFFPVRWRAWPALRPLVNRIAAAATHGPGEDADPYARSANPEAFLRALYLQLAIGPRPPAVRSDLLLVLVEALRRSNPWTLAPDAH